MDQFSGPALESSNNIHRVAPQANDHTVDARHQFFLYGRDDFSSPHMRPVTPPKLWRGLAFALVLVAPFWAAVGYGAWHFFAKAPARGCEQAEHTVFIDSSTYLCMRDAVTPAGKSPRAAPTR